MSSQGLNCLQLKIIPQSSTSWGGPVLNPLDTHDRILFSQKKEYWLMHAMVWMDIQNLIPYERSQTWKATYYMLAFIWTIQSRSIYRNKVEWQLPIPANRGGRDCWWVQGSSLGWWKCPGMAMVTQSCGYTENHWNVYFERVDFMVCEWYLNLEDKSQKTTKRSI